MKDSSRLNRTLTWLAASAFMFQTAIAATVTWSGAGGNDNWSTVGNWTGGTPAANDVLFIDDDATGFSGPYGTANNIVDASLSVLSLTYGNTNGFHTTQIPSGSILTVGGTANPIIFVGTGTDNGAVQTVYATVLGQGSLLVTNSAGVVSVIQGSTTAGAKLATLDMEGLDTFIAHVNQIRVGAENGGSSSPFYNRPNATLVLARTNLITCTGSPGLRISRTASNGGTAEVKLGQDNIILSNAGIEVGGRKSVDSKLSFNPSVWYAAHALFRDEAGTGRQATWTVGDQSQQTSTTGTSASGTADFSYGTVDALVDTIIVGRGAANTTANGAGMGTLTFDTGTIDVNTLDIAVTGNSGLGGPANGTVNINGTGLLVVNTAIRLGVDGGTSHGALNINGGTVWANTIENGVTNNEVTISFGKLVVTNTAGSPAFPFHTLTVTDGTLGFGVTEGVTNVHVNNLLDYSSTPTPIDILSLPPITGYPAQYPLISYLSYSPGFAGLEMGSLPSASPAYQGYISNNTVKGTIDLVITGGPAPARALTWNGNVNGDWNTTTPNWLFSASSTLYNQGDYVTFDDSASGVTRVNLTTSLRPFTLTVSNHTKNYTLNGSGTLDGAVALVKDGSGSLTLGNSGENTFAGGVSILGGTLELSGSADRLPTNSAVTLADVSGAALDLNGLNQTLESMAGGGASGGNILLGSGTLTISGGGGFAGVISGSGQLVKTNYDTGGFLTLSNANTYSGGTIIGGYTAPTYLTVVNPVGSGTGSGFVRVLTNGSLRIGNGGADGSVAATTITNDGIVRVDLDHDLTLNKLIVGAGGLEKYNTNNTLTLAGINSYTGGTLVQEGALRLNHSGAVGSGTVSVQNGTTAVLQLTGGITMGNPLLIASKPSAAAGGVANVLNLSGTNTLAGPIGLRQNGSIGWIFESAAGHLLVSGTHTPVDPSETSQTTTRTLWLRGDATGEWSSDIVDSVDSTRNLRLVMSGPGTWTLSGANTYTGPTTISNGNLFVNGMVSGSDFTVNGGTLGGNGSISAPVTVESGGTLAPGTSIGKLTVLNTLTLTSGSRTVIELSKAGGTIANDQVDVLTTLTLGGTLQVVLLGTVTGGEEFQLFTVGTPPIQGAFEALDLPALPNPLGWDSSTLNTDGALRVTGGLPTLEYERSGNTLTFNWTGAYKLQSKTNELNVGLGGGVWADYPGGGTSGVTATINSANPTVFFRLVPL